MSFDLLAHIAGLPRLRSAAGVLFRDAAGGVLLVRPTYKDGWEVPGGGIEADESPLAAAHREVREELGVTAPIGRLLVLDWIAATPPWDAGLMFIFDGGVLDPEVTARIVLPADELSEFRFVPPTDLPSFLPPRLSRRVVAALDPNTPVYLEEGYEPAPSRGSGVEAALTTSDLAPGNGQPVGYQTSPSRQSQVNGAVRSRGSTPGKT
ncbi:NUDIX domain-containing protein [Asanoa siamensis]|uniref:Nudix hydrolase domain-containing protein n=1 Tax=Asanoa siamensis TaxID=926357 RepID=A0ABQ4CYI2_9ACTN|nr:NUDIX hydrolase [Asanoa siamensis]GIF76361.1 hypothetical protein Asi02nite_58790 [Asanoa siamensis]